MFVTALKKFWIFILLGLSCASALAQNASPQLEPTNQPDKKPPVISFTLDYPAATPPFYNIALDSTGRAEYKSTPKPKNEGDPYELKFVFSEVSRTKLFDLARQLDFFRGNFDYTKSRIAFTGTKTLLFENGSEQHQTSYNWSENTQIQEITAIFQGTAATIEMGRQLEDKYRFDKLGVNALLKTMDEEVKGNRAIELQTIQPILTRIAKDPGMMNISRRIAESMLARIPKSPGTANGGQQ